MKKNHLLIFSALLLIYTYQAYLSSIRRMILQNLDCYNFISAFLPTFDHLTECPSTQKLQYLILIGHGIQHLMLDQLVISIGAWTRAYEPKISLIMQLFTSSLWLLIGLSTRVLPGGVWDYILNIMHMI